MSAKKIGSVGSFENSINVAGREAALELPAEKVSVNQHGIEFCSPAAFTEWSEMTVTLQSPRDGSKHSGYHVSMLFTSMTPQVEKQLGVMARSEFGVG